MPRPLKRRFVCCLPKACRFLPAEQTALETVYMTVDEYETIRLIDLENATQEDCSEQMQIARTTVQAIYASARQKVADTLVNGKQLIITGGDVTLCGCYCESCGRGCQKLCRRKQCY